MREELCTHVPKTDSDTKPSEMLVQMLLVSVPPQLISTPPLASAIAAASVSFTFKYPFMSPTPPQSLTTYLSIRVGSSK